MNTLEKILALDLIIANENIKLRKLRDKYILENATYKKDKIVNFNKAIFGEEIVLGIIQDVMYKESDRGLIRYTIRRIKKNGERHRGDGGFYYNYQGELNKIKQP